MRRYLIGLTALFALVASGCGGKDVGGDLYNLDHYGNVQPHKIQFQGITWGVLDKPEEGRMLVVPLDSAQFEQYDAAAREYFELSKRKCTVISKKLASRTDFSVEFLYSCES